MILVLASVGRSMPAMMAKGKRTPTFLSEIHGYGIDLYLHRQGIDTVPLH